MRNFVVELPDNCRDASRDHLTVSRESGYDENKQSLGIPGVPAHIPMNYTLDLDAVAGPFKMNRFHTAFKCNISLNLSNSFVRTPGNMIKSNDYVRCARGSKHLVKRLPHSKLGTSDTPIGVFDIYVVSKVKRIDTEEFQRRVFLAVSSAISSENRSVGTVQLIKTVASKDSDDESKTLKGPLVIDNSGDLFRKLKRSLKKEKAFIYIETFGNKRDTITSLSNADLIQKKLSSVIKQKEQKKLKIDVCISVSAGEDRITLAKNNLFKSIDVTPNYLPFISNAVLNLNKKTVGSTGSRTALGRDLGTDKINFYSSIKRLFNYDSRSSYKTPKSLYLLKTGLFDNVILGRRSKSSATVSLYDSLMDEYSKMFIKEFPYRMEFRCSPAEYPVLLTKMQVHLMNYNFGSLKSEVFINYISKDIRAFNDLIMSGGASDMLLYSPENWVTSVITELVFINCYIKGSPSVPLINKPIRDYIDYPSLNDYVSLKAINVSGITRAIRRSLSGHEIKKIIDDIILYNRLDQNNKNKSTGFKDGFFAFLQIWNSSASSLASKIEMIISNYNKLNADASKESNHNVKYEVVNARSESAYDIIPQIFVKDEKGRSNLLTLVFDSLKYLHSIDNDDLVNEIVACFERVAVKSVFDPKSKTNSTVNLLYGNEARYKNKLVSKSKAKLIEDIDKLASKTYSTVSATEEELIRLINGLFIYKNSAKKFSSLSDDFAYGFHMTRSSSWLRNRTSFLNKFAKDRNTFNRIMKRVREWTPSDFSFSQHLEYHSSCDINMSLEMKDLYNTILLNDSESWYNRNANAFKDISDADIFFAVIPAARRKELDINELNSWSFNNIPVLNEAEYYLDTPFEPATIELDYYENNIAFETEHIIETTSIINDCYINNDLNPFEIEPDDINENIDNKTYNASEIEVDKDKVMFYKDKLFKKYGYSVFNSSKARKYLFKMSNRLETNIWNSIINELEEKLVISPVNKYGNYFKFNIQLLNGRFLDHNKIMDAINRYTSIKQPFTLSNIRENITVSLRPSKPDLELYLLNMVKDGTLSMIDSKSKIKRFKLVEK